VKVTRLLRLIGLFLLTVSSIALTYADDGYVENLGGSVYLMKGHSTIRMVSEEVHMKALTAEVTADFVFRNEGKATKVLMGFPEGRPAVGKSIFSFYKTWVDGKPVKARILPNHVVNYKYGIAINWRVKEVPFARGQTRRVRVQYKSTPFTFYANGEDDEVEVSPYPLASHMYVLQTGASWKGTIGRVRVICDLTGIDEQMFVGAGPDPTRESPRQLVWEYRNLEPTSDNDIVVTWNEAFTHFRVDGVDPFKSPNFLNKEQQVVWDPDYSRAPFRRGDDLFVPVRALESWTSTTIRYSRQDNRLTLSRNGRSMSFPASQSLTARCDDIPVPVVYKDGDTYISIFAAAKALAFNASWVGKHERVDVKN
jgi:hypothetical protein